MTKVYFTSDPHYGHEGSLEWARDYRVGKDVDEMNEWLIDQWNSVVTKRDLVHVLGDVTFQEKYIKLIDRLQGRKQLILGNHDTLHLTVYLKYFEKVWSYKKYKGFWLSHMPIHEYDMVNCRVRGNIHGHLHQNEINDPRYHNVCVEHWDGKPVSFEELIGCQKL